MALRTVVSTKSVKVSPCLRTDSSSARNSGSTRIWGMTAVFTRAVYCVWVTPTRIVYSGDATAYLDVSRAGDPVRQKCDDGRNVLFLEKRDTRGGGKRRPSSDSIASFACDGRVSGLNRYAPALATSGCSAYNLTNLVRIGKAMGTWQMQTAKARLAEVVDPWSMGAA